MNSFTPTFSQFLLCHQSGKKKEVSRQIFLKKRMHPANQQSLLIGNGNHSNGKGNTFAKIPRAKVLQKKIPPAVSVGRQAVLYLVRMQLAAMRVKHGHAPVPPKSSTLHAQYQMLAYKKGLITAIIKTNRHKPTAIMLT